MTLFYLYILQKRYINEKTNNKKKSIVEIRQ